MPKKNAPGPLSIARDSFLSLFLVSHLDALVALGSVPLTHIPFLYNLEVGRSAVRQPPGGGSPPVFPCRALRVRKKMSGEKMPVKMIGDILSAQLPHMQPYIRFCSCQLNGAALIQQKTDEAPDFKEFVKVRGPGRAQTPPSTVEISGPGVCEGSSESARVFPRKASRG